MSEVAMFLHEKAFNRKKGCELHREMNTLKWSFICKYSARDRLRTELGVKNNKKTLIKLIK